MILGQQRHDRIPHVAGLSAAVQQDYWAALAANEVMDSNSINLGVVLGEMSNRLARGVCRALIPMWIVGRLFCREDLDEPLREAVEPVRHRHMPVERRGIELREHIDAANVRMQAVADGNVNEPVLPANGYRRLRPGR